MPGKKNTWDESLTAAASARARLPRMVQAFFEAGRELAGSPTPPGSMHKFRLEAKALRYTIELFRTCYGPGLERYLAGLRTIQDQLGAISDFAATAKMLDPDLPVQAFLASGLQRRWLSFRRYWRRTFDLPGHQRRFQNYLFKNRSA